MRSFCTIAPWPLVLLGILAVPRAMAQSGTESPYSAYGLGNLVGNTQISQLIMGGVSVAVTDPAGISTVNPASYTGLRKTALEGGLVGQMVRFTSNTASQDRSGNQFLGFTLGIPWNSSRWGLAVGLLPVSTVNYNVGDSDTLAGGGLVELQYTGTGGLNRGFAGLAHTLWRSKPDSTGRVKGRLSLGANVSYLFGTTESTRRAVYPGGAGYSNFSSYTGLVLRGAGVNFGLLHNTELVSMERIERRRRERDLKRKAAHQSWLEAHPGQERAAPKPFHTPTVPLRIQFGATMELPTDLGATRNILERTFITSNGVDRTEDTTFFAEGQKGSIIIPPSYGFGLSVIGERWTMSGDVRWRDWSALRLEVEDLSLYSELRPSSTYSLGASFRPAWERDRNYLKRVIYRAGARYTTDYLRVQDIQLHEVAFSTGLSLPLSEGNYLSRVNVGVMAGTRGKAGEGTLEERFVNFYFGLTLTPNMRERWFSPTHIE